MFSHLLKKERDWAPSMYLHSILNSNPKRWIYDKILQLMSTPQSIGLISSDTVSDGEHGIDAPLPDTLNLCPSPRSSQGDVDIIDDSDPYGPYQNQLALPTSELDRLREAHWGGRYRSMNISKVNVLYCNFLTYPCRQWTQLIPSSRNRLDMPH